MEIRNCKICKKEFNKPKTCSQKEWNRVYFFCSRKCANFAKLGSLMGISNSAKRPEVRAKISKALKGKKKSPEHINKLKLINIGRKASEKTRRRMQASAPRGENSHLWRGGITKQNRLARQSSEYKLWRIAVFERDNYTCIWCGYKSCKKINGKSDIQADHIKPFSLFPELRFAIDNGRTLCIPCHRTTDTWGKFNLNKPTT
jgi:5-methylcytosine-specific restriction endonuclease McrA